MRPSTRNTLAAGLLAAVAAPTHAQSLEIAWHTVDAGGGPAAGTTLSIGATIGQPDAGALAGLTLSVTGGFWTELSACPGDFNVDGTVDTRDFLAFLNAWTLRDPRSDFNNDGTIDSRDVLAFLNEWTIPCE